MFCYKIKIDVSNELRNVRTVKRIIREINESKKKLESIIGTDIEYFAYPYGSKYACSKKVIKCVEKAGYKNAFSTYSMAINKKYIIRNKFFVPRINVDKKLINKVENINEKND